MIVFPLTTALVLGLILAALTSGITRRWGGIFLYYFMLIFLAIWAGSLWIRPVGPAIYDLYWVPILVLGFIMVTVLLMNFPYPASSAPGSLGERVFGPAFWILVVLFVITIIIGYATA